MMTVGSLFTGVGGLDLGLERAGMKVLWQVEKDEYARRVLRKHWPKARCYEDVRECFGPTGARGNYLDPVDLICGGFPCQDISVAGKGKGIKEGTRSGLWIEFARIVRELRPRYVLVENVPALRSRGLDRVLGDLAACGYDAEWDCIPAAAVGAPHRRDRIFIVAYAKREFLWVESGRGSRTNGRGSAQSADHGAPWVMADAMRSGLEESRHGRGDEGSATPRIFAAPARDSAWSSEPDVGRVAHGVPSRVDRLRCLGNAVVPQVAEYVGRRIITFEASHD
jgi:DNA (cytosine-5)-methyltransferase 1